LQKKKLFTRLHDDTKIKRQYLDVRQKGAASIPALPRLPPAKMSLNKLSLAGNNLMIPGRENLVSDIPAGDGKIANFFYSVGAGPGNCCTFLFEKLFKINYRVPLQSGKILENRRKSRTLKTTTVSSVVQYSFIIFVFF
jgi:hypothetical protein